ncbi:MAG: hypothetical protein ACSHYF_14615 [Verrucomicrobiaceae bacterium]
MKVPQFLFLVGVLLAAASCKRVAELDKEAPAILVLWDARPGDVWEYRVTATYAGIVQPRLWTPEERLRHEGGRTVLEFQRQVTYVEDREVNEGKGYWGIFEARRGNLVEEREFLQVRGERIVYWGSQVVGAEPGRVKSLQVPVDLIRRGMEGGDRWEYELGGGEEGTRRGFRVAGWDEVTVPMGTVVAEKVILEGRSGGLEVKEVYWFSQRYGFLKREKYFYGEEDVVKREVMELVGMRRAAESGLDK